MFRVITVEREYGAGGSLVAAQLARRKGWQLLDQQLTCEIAKLASVDEKAVARREEKCDPLMHRLAKVFWRGSYERSLPISDDKLFVSDEMVELATAIIEKKGEEGNCVIVGRGGPYILRNRQDTFRVFVYGSLDPNIRTAKVRIEVQNPGFMRLGMFVKATFRGQTTVMHTLVPASAVLRMHDRDFVFVPAPGKKFRRVEVVSGDLLPDDVSLEEIKSGLQPGQQVVTNALVLDHVLAQ